MRQIQSVFIGCGILLLLMLCGGCGSPLPTSTFTPTSTPDTSTHAVPAGSVTVHPNASFYQTGDTIALTVTNQSTQTILFPDHLTNCTVILLQRQKAQPRASDGGQGGINPCLRTTATHMHALSAGHHLIVSLVAPRQGWPVGVYLATLRYHTASAPGSPTTLSSQAFAIGPPGPQP